MALGRTGTNSLYVYDEDNSKWKSINHFEYFKLKKTQNDEDEFEFKIYAIRDKEKKYLNRGAKVMFFSGKTLLLKGRIQRINFGTSYSCNARGYGMEVKLKDKELVKDGSKRVQYTNTSAQSIAEELLSKNVDGASPWIISPSSEGLFDTDYGDVTVRFEHGNRLAALAKLADAISYDWWVEQDSNYDDFFYIDAHQGSQTSVKTYRVTGNGANAVKTDKEVDDTNMANDVTVLGYGDGINQLEVNTYAASTVNSKLASDITASDETISLVDASDFPDSGEVRIMSERITYTGKDGNDLTGCTRGANDTEALSHKKNVYIEEYYSRDSPETGSSIEKNDLKEKTKIDRDIIERETAELVASKYLIEHKDPLIRIKVEPYDPVGDSQDLQIGDVVTIQDTESDIDGDYRVVGIKYKSDYGNLGMEVEVSNKTLEFVEQLKEEKERNESMQKYMQGATNLYAISEKENCDDSHPLNMLFYLPSEAIAINRVLLSFKLKDFRAYSSTIESESTHTHDITINDETDASSISIIGIESGKLYSGFGTGAVSTTESGSSHDHPIGYGIYEESLSSPEVTLSVGEEGSESSVGTFTSNQNNLDVTSEVKEVGAGNWINIKFSANKRMRIEANAYIQIFIESE